ncbi:MAG: heparinase II/III family protein [Lachnospiraceae bacterium]|nr:heparinase II/III family protein [Lachnospiraceae bacterium]
MYLVKNRLTRGKTAVTAAQAPGRRVLPLWWETLDEDPLYLQRFDAEEILCGNVTLLHEDRKAAGEHSHLWNFNLHYLEYLIPLVAEYRRTGEERWYAGFKEACIGWIRDNRSGDGDGWHPYTISLRLTNLLICMDGLGEILEQDGEFVRELSGSMYAQYLHLQRNLERHLLANHYFENLKAVLLGSLYFREENTYSKYRALLRREIAAQILPDGVHYERSLMYHKIILEDLMRVAGALSGIDDDFGRELLEPIQRMADAMCVLEEGAGRTPLFNDAGDNVARSMESLLNGLREQLRIVPTHPAKRAFPDAGYYCLTGDGIKILMDAGEIAPTFAAGHGHCDALSFELFIQGQPVFVNSGTGLYQGALRPYFRSTAAHNTVVIDGQEQSECWGEHRVARRIFNVSGSCGKGWIEGALTTCTGKRQERRIELGGRTIRILDTVKGRAQAYLHLAPEWEYIQQGRKILLRKRPGMAVVSETSEKSKAAASACPGGSAALQGIITVRGDEVLRIHREGNLALYAPEFGQMVKIQTLEIFWMGDGTAHEIEIEFQKQE